MATGRRLKIVPTLAGLAILACSPGPTPAPVEPASSEGDRPSILLVTLDTTRADSLGYASAPVETPNLNALASRGLRFSQAYAAAPMTLPSHLSMMTGLYPGDHGIHENTRYLGGAPDLLAELLRKEGYATRAVVSAYPLARQFGLARGFDHYDDDFGVGRSERGAGETADRAVASLNAAGREALFLWVHFFDPHDPYDPPEPFRTLYEDDLYLGEIAYLDRELGRVLESFEKRLENRPRKILVVGDHGEGRGDHGEALHGNLLYQGVMRVPLLLAGTGVDPGARSEPVSTRRVFDTVLGWVGKNRPHSLESKSSETVLGEAMRPYLQYGWQPQVMAVREGIKMIRSGGTEIYDVRSDPAEATNLAGRLRPPAELVEAIRSYPLPEPEGSKGRDSGTPLSEEDRQRLAALGYAAGGGTPTLREDAPNPKDMTHLFTDLDLASALFVRKRYKEAIPVFERIVESDSKNLAVILQLASAHSLTGRDERALELFDKARAIDPASVDARHYLGMHHFRREHWRDAEPLLASVLAASPRRLPALEALALIQESRGRHGEAARLLEQIVELKQAPASELLRLGRLGMASGRTPDAIHAFERAREIQGKEFTHSLELGVCYLAARRLFEAGESLDRVDPAHAAYPMALFKRAQVAVLLDEPDREEKIRLARERADETTRPLIANERLFRVPPTN